MPKVSGIGAKDKDKSRIPLSDTALLTTLRQARG
jgi:hypothetical protein